MGNKKRIPENKIVRVPQMEQKFGIQDMKIYAYMDGIALSISGEIVANSIKSGFHLKCNVYDQDGDMVESAENNSYGGSGLVTNRIAKKSFYNGFPFSFYIYLNENCKISKVQIMPM